MRRIEKKKWPDCWWIIVRSKNAISPHARSSGGRHVRPTEKRRKTENIKPGKPIDEVSGGTFYTYIHIYTYTYAYYACVCVRTRTRVCVFVRINGVKLFRRNVCKWRDKTTACIGTNSLPPRPPPDVQFILTRCI